MIIKPSTILLVISFLSSCKTQKYNPEVYKIGNTCNSSNLFMHRISEFKQNFNSDTLATIECLITKKSLDDTALCIFYGSVLTTKHIYDLDEYNRKLSVRLSTINNYPKYCPNNFLALYFATQLYYNKFTLYPKIAIGFKNSQGDTIVTNFVNQVPDDGSKYFIKIKYNTIYRNELIEIYKIYNEWLQQVKIIGLKEAHRQNLDPLSNSKYKWVE